MMNIRTTATNLNGEILPQYTADGDDISPPVEFIDVPMNAKSLALIMDDPDAPSGTFTHWIVFNMLPTTLKIEEAKKPPSGRLGVNDFGKIGYEGPCPPFGEHEYHFRLYALGDMLDLPVGSDRDAVEEAMQGHVIEKAELVASYSKDTIMAA